MPPHREPVASRLAVSAGSRTRLSPCAHGRGAACGTERRSLGQVACVEASWVSRAPRGPVSGVASLVKWLPRKGGRRVTNGSAP